MVALDLEFQPALSGWANPSSWSSQEYSGAVVLFLHVVCLFFLCSLWSQHSGSPGQAEFCLLVVSTALLCVRHIHILICMGSVQREWILHVNKLPLKCKFRILKHYWVLGILLLWTLNSFKGNQYFSSSFLVLLVWFSPLWNFFFSNHFMLSHCMQNSWIVLEPWNVEHCISGQQQLLHVVLWLSGVHNLSIPREGWYLGMRPPLDSECPEWENPWFFSILFVIKIALELEIAIGGRRDANSKSLQKQGMCLEGGSLGWCMHHRSNHILLTEGVLRIDSWIIILMCACYNAQYLYQNPEKSNASHAAF